MRSDEINAGSPEAIRGVGLASHQIGSELEFSLELKQSDFSLTDEQLLEINRKFSSLVDTRPEAVVNPYHVVSVTFEFSSLGKLMSAYSKLCFDEQEAIYADVKPFTNADVLLTDEQLREVNRHYSEGILAVLARDGTQSDLSPKVIRESLRLWVTFQFGPGWRSFEACFGDDDEMEVQCYRCLPECWGNSSVRFTEA